MRGRKMNKEAVFYKYEDGADNWVWAYYYTEGRMTVKMGECSPEAFPRYKKEAADAGYKVQVQS
jgi:hypothetical protein